MNEDKTGGPAFSTPADNGHLMTQDGITMRDYFAAKAMQGFVSDPDWRIDMGPDNTAYAAYKHADAMLKAREE